MKVVPVVVGIPTYSRGLRVAETLMRVLEADPAPAEVMVHIDASTGQLEPLLREQFPSVRVISSQGHVGPGGGRHRCLQAASAPYFVSFDDDSWPLHRDFFGKVVKIFDRRPDAAILAASIQFPARSTMQHPRYERIVSDYTGCGYAIRTEAYRQTTGHIDRTPPYGIEEVDIAMQLHAQGWNILECSDLQVFHDTELTHHKQPDIVAGVVQNVALRAFLRYPVCLWPRAVLQLANVVLDELQRRRFAGLASGIVGIPATLYRYASYRRPIPSEKIRSYFELRLPTAS